MTQRQNYHYLWHVSSRIRSLIRGYVFTTILLCSIPAIATAAGSGDSVKERVAALISEGAVILHDENGSTLLSINADKLLVPASIIKIVTAAIALDVLGSQYRFKTQVFRDSADNLAIKGWGDPFLVSEEIELMAQQLRNRSITKVKKLFLDHSNFSDFLIPGVSRTLNPYDAINGALVVNFNTLNLGKDVKGTIFSAEEVTPLTPMALLKGRLIKSGTTERINLLDNRKECQTYASQLIAGLFQKNGIAVGAEAQEGLTVSDTTTWKEVYTHYNSRTIADVCKELLKYSNNFIANQIFVTIGAAVSGYPATLEKGKAACENHVRNVMKIPHNQLSFYEGSGISRDNRITAAAMMVVLEKYRGTSALLSEKKGVLCKSGTLTGVHNYAGYIQTGLGLRPFVIMLNQKNNTRDKLLDLLVHIGKK
ncbi:MAG: D-alanyl-D-alanine carboxypeptidase [Chitinivibrionales bacterium]|nr:D-alanyl-D-alanine carboxypeptidase [Chitinivibrionales bacterium]